MHHGNDQSDIRFAIAEGTANRRKLAYEAVPPSYFPVAIRNRLNGRSTADGRCQLDYEGYGKFSVIKKTNRTDKAATGATGRDMLR